MPKATWNGVVLAESDAAKHVKGYVAFWKGVEVK